MTDHTNLDFSRLLGFGQLGAQTGVAADVRQDFDFRDPALGATLGAKRGVETTEPNGLNFRDPAISATLGAKVGVETV